MTATALRFSALALILLVAALYSLCVGQETIPLATVLEALLDPQHPEADPTDVAIVRYLRMERILLALVMGAGLGAAGAGFQGLFRNPLADPFVIGASSGAALGATLALILGAPLASWLHVERFWGGLDMTSLAALIGALAAVGLVYSIAVTGRQAPTIALLLAGAAVSSFMSAAVALLMFLNEDHLAQIVVRLQGSLQGRGATELWSAAPIVAVGVVGLWFCSRGLDALTFGEESAAALGLSRGRVRTAVVVTSSLATAACVAASGIIGFVGLMAPHAARLWIGPRHALVIPASCLVGALLVLLADDLARTVVERGEIPVGVVTSLLGGPFFLYLLKTRQGQLEAGL